MKPAIPPGERYQLGAVAPEKLVDSRIQLHWAAQLAAFVGNRFVEVRADDSHSNLGWDESSGALLSHPATRGGFRSGLRFADLSLLLIVGGKEAANLPLDGKTLEEALSWIAAATAEHAGATSAEPLALRDYDMPVHPVMQGAAFDASDEAERGELARWYAAADRAIRVVAAENVGASSVRCWPHHFDLASLIVLDPERPAEEARSIGVGMSPGDGSYAVPYWYVNPWPHPTPDALPTLPSGSWHTEGWVGAVLTGPEVAAAGDQEALISGFHRAAVEACRAALGAATEVGHE